MDSKVPPSHMSNKLKSARDYALDCVDISARCWDIVYGSVNLNKFFSEKMSDTNEEDSSMTGLPELSFENFMYTFAQSTDEPLETIWVLYDWCLNHLLEDKNELGDIPRNSTTLVHITKLFAMNKLHQRRAAIRHEADDVNGNVENDEEGTEMQGDDDSQSQDDESMEIDNSTDGVDTITETDDNLTNEVFDDMFPPGLRPRYHRILLFLCEELLELPVVATELSKRYDRRNEFMKKLRSADTNRRKITSQWNIQQKEKRSTSKSEKNGTNSSTSKSNATSAKNTVATNEGMNKEKKAESDIDQPKHVDMEEYEKAIEDYESLRDMRLNCEYMYRSIGE